MSNEQSILHDYIGSLPPVVRKGEFVQFEDLTDEQQQVARGMLQEIQAEDIYNAIAAAFETIDRLTSVVSGNISSDLNIEFDPQTRQTTWSFKQRPDQRQGEEAILGKAEKEFMVYQRKANDEETGAEIYGFDYVRSVGAAEE